MLTETQLKAELTKKSFRSTYLLFGDDPYLVKHYTDLAAEKIVGENRDLNLAELSESTGVDRIFEAINQLSFTGDRLCVLVRDYNFESCPIKDFKALQQTISNAPVNNTLILCCEAFEITPKKSDRFKKLAATIEGAGGGVCQLNHKSNAQLIKMLCDGAARRGCTLRPDAAGYLIETCTNDLNILQNELEKLVAYVNSGEITRETIDCVCPKTVAASIYDLARHIMNGQGDRAIRLLHDLQLMGLSNVEILANITGFYVDLYRAKAAAKSGISADRAAEDLGYPKNRAFVMKNAMRDARAVSDKALSEILRELLLADKIVKGESKLSAHNGTAQLEYLITRFIMITRG